MSNAFSSIYGENAPGAEGVLPLSEIEVMIRARYPLLYVVTWEEERALVEIHRISQLLGKKVYDWTISNGIARYRAAVDGRNEGRKDTKDPIIALREVQSNAEPAIFVFRDFHDFMQNSEVKRRLRDLAAQLRSSFTTIVILSPLMRLPEELEKDISIIDFPLPSRSDIDALILQIGHDIAENPALSVDTSPESREAIIDASIGLTLNEAENVFAKTLVAAQQLTAAEAPLIYTEKKQVIRKSGLLEYIDVSDTLSSVGGLDQLKAWIGRRRAAMDPQAAKFGLPSPRGLLLVGVQGCGKSLAAKSTAAELNYPLVRLDVGRLFSKMVGETESNIRRALAIAEAIAPVVLWIDELEKGLSGIRSSDSTDGGTTSRLFATILTWLQEKKSPVFVVATANDIEKLPPEVLRKGRFDEIFFVDLPAEDERREIFAIHLARRNRPPGKFDLDLLASVSEGFSGAEIEQSVIEAMFSVYGIKSDIETADLVLALKRMVPLSRTMGRSISERRMWAIGRTVSASSASDMQESLEQAGAEEQEKDKLYFDYLNLRNTASPNAAQAAAEYLGTFPKKQEDAEKMKLYLQNYSKLIKEITE